MSVIAYYFCIDIKYTYTYTNYTYTYNLYLHAYKYTYTNLTNTNTTFIYKFVKDKSYTTNIYTKHIQYMHIYQSILWTCKNNFHVTTCIYKFRITNSYNTYNSYTNFILYMNFIYKFYIQFIYTFNSYTNFI